MHLLENENITLKSVYMYVHRNVLERKSMNHRLDPYSDCPDKWTTFLGH